LGQKYAFRSHASVRAPQDYPGSWVFLLSLPKTWQVGTIFQGEKRFSEGFARHVKKAPEDPCREESAESLHTVNSDIDVHVELFQTEN
jgi:hypothetical protein